MTTPHILTGPDLAQSWSLTRRRAGERISLVPTMGALHAGHLSLIDAARRHSDRVMVSIFVNPTQFNRQDDFDAYPRTVDDDIELCRNAGVDAIYLPTVETMYPTGFATTIEPGPIAQHWEGTHRPGHFAGVATVVVKLLLACAPDVAVFGRKDLQQLAVISRTVTDLNIATAIVGAPTIREADGLAMSSRNRRLSPDARSRATAIHRGLLAAVTSAARSGDVDQIERAALADIEPAADSIEYVAVIDRATFVRPTGVCAPDSCALIVAAWFDGVRLIDNMTLDGLD
jgi:pantoate--beta-alanine ligase